MAEFYIDYRKLKNTNGLLPNIVANVNLARRNIGVLRWRIPEELLVRRNLRNRLNEVYGKLQNIEQRVNSIYNFTNNCIIQYKNVEQTNQNILEEFL